MKRPPFLSPRFPQVSSVYIDASTSAKAFLYTRNSPNYTQPAWLDIFTLVRQVEHGRMLQPAMFFTHDLFFEGISLTTDRHYTEVALSFIAPIHTS